MYDLFNLLTGGKKTPRWSSPVSFFGMGVYGKYYLAILLLTVVPAVLASSPRTADASGGNVLTGCVDSYDPTFDYFPDKAHDHGNLFTVTYFNSYKLVNVTSLVYGFTALYVLYQCGTPPPSGYDGVTTIAVPVTSLGLDETVDATFIELLGERMDIALLNSPELFVSPCIQYLAQNGSITAWTNASQTSEVDVYFADAYNWAGASLPSPNVAVDLSDEATPLDRAVWLEFFGLFFNQEVLSGNIYHEIATRYNCHTANIKALAVSHPLVAVVAIYGAPYAGWQVSIAPYVQTYIEDAGGQLFVPTTGYPSGTTVQFDSLEDLLAAIQNVDFVLDESYPSLANWDDFLALYDISNTANYTFARNGNVYTDDRLQNTGGNQDWYEGAFAEPDAVLRDFITMLHPSYPFVAAQTIWLRKLSDASQEIVYTSADQCTDPGLPLPLPSDTCVIIPTSTPTATPTPNSSSVSAPFASFIVACMLLAIVFALIA